MSRCLAFCETKLGIFGFSVLYQPTSGLSWPTQPTPAKRRCPTRTKLQSCEVGLRSSIHCFTWESESTTKSMVGWTEKKDYFSRDLSSTILGDYYFMGLWRVVVNDRCLFSPFLVRQCVFFVQPRNWTYPNAQCVWVYHTLSIWDFKKTT